MPSISNSFPIFLSFTSSSRPLKLYQSQSGEHKKLSCVPITRHKFAASVLLTRYEEAMKLRDMQHLTVLFGRGWMQRVGREEVGQKKVVFLKSNEPPYTIRDLSQVLSVFGA